MNLEEDLKRGSSFRTHKFQSKNDSFHSRIQTITTTIGT